VKCLRGRKPLGTVVSEMWYFGYRAMTPAGEPAAGEVEVPSPREVSGGVQCLGHATITRQARSGVFRTRTPRPCEKTTFLRQIAVLVGICLSLKAPLQSLWDKAGKASAWFGRTCSAAADGFTLIELLVVLTIIGLIMGLIGPRVLGYLEDSRAKTAKLQIESLSSALDLFYLDAGRYPTTSEGLDALAQRPSDIAMWNGPYIKGGRVPVDPWGHSYQYRSPVDHTPPYEIVSFGSDGREGGSGNAADISNVEH
jgi:general secretion pathway protein G